MRDALNKTGTHVYYSIHGPQDVPALANCWRTTGDISNDWESIVERAVANDRHAHAAGPGSFNDPDVRHPHPLLLYLTPFGKPLLAAVFTAFRICGTYPHRAADVGGWKSVG